MSKIRRSAFWIALGAITTGLSAAGPSPRVDQGVGVRLKAPLLVCHALAGGVRPDPKKGAEAEHDLIFFVLAGRNPDGTELREVAPKGGGYLKIDSQRSGKLVKNVDLWKGRLAEGQAVIFILSAREQDGKDSAEADLKEASELAPKVDHARGLADLARLPVHEILRGEHGENDHLGSVVVRVRNVNGSVTLDTEPGADVKYLKGFASNDPRRRAFRLTGDRSDYELHLSLDD
jgi:hypothetical protein